MKKLLKPILASLHLPDLFFPAHIAFIIGLVFYKNFFTALRHVKNEVIIGQATYHGVDIGLRIQKFYYTAFIILIAFLFLSALYSFLYRRVGISRVNKTTVNTLSLLSAVVMLTSFFVEPEWSSVSKVFFADCLVTCIAAWATTKKQVFSWDKISLALILSYVFTICIADVFRLSEWSISNSRIMIVAVSLYVVLLVVILMRNEEGLNKFMKLSVWLVCFPLAFFITNEAFVFFQKRVHIDIPLPLIYVVCLAFIFLIAFYRARREKGYSTEHYRFFIGLWFVLSLSCSAYYKTVISDFPLDDFELANSSNSAMNIFKFHLIPIVDFFSSHLLYDQLPSIFYFSVHGYNANLDDSIYSFFYYVLSYCSVYILLQHIFKKKFTALFLTVFLTNILDYQFPMNYGMALVVLVFMLRFFKNPVPANFFYFFAVLLFSMAMRVDIAVGICPAVLVCFFVWFFSASQKDTGKLITKHLIVWVVFLFFIVLLLFAIRKNLFANLQDILSYIRSSQAHGRSEIFIGNHYGINIHYFILPVVTLFMSLASFFLYAKKKLPQTTILLVAFFTAFYFFNYQRGLVRHAFTYGEGLAFLSSFLMFLLPYNAMVLLRIKAYRVWIFTALSILVVLAFKIDDITERSMIQASFNELGVRRFIKKEEVNNRVSNYLDYKNRFDSLGQFMDKNFEKEASFIDMSNTPMMYYYLQKRVPGYFCQYIQNMVTASIQERNITQLVKQDLPVVVYSSYPKHEFFDRTDGVENSIRYYKIANYIFNHYHPFGVISGKYVWLKNGLPVVFDNSEKLSDSVVYKPEFFSLDRLAYYWAEACNADKNTTKIKRINDTVWILPPAINKSNGNYILVELNNNGDATTLYAEYAEGGIVKGEFDFFVNAHCTAQKYLIPISTQYNWYHFSPDHLIIKSLPEHHQITVKNVSLHTGL